MPTRRFRTRTHALLTTVAALSAFAVTGPAWAQTDSGSRSSSTPTGPSSQPMQSAGATTSAAAAGTSTAPNQNDNAKTSAQTAVQSLPEPKPSDYAASTYNAPSDAELAMFEATHRPPPNTGQSNSNGSSNGTTNKNGSNTDNPTPDNMNPSSNTAGLPPAPGSQTSSAGQPAQPSDSPAVNPDTDTSTD